MSRPEFQDGFKLTPLQQEVEGMCNLCLEKQTCRLVELHNDRRVFVCIECWSHVEDEFEADAE